jgi:lipoprotein-anchoring transpeptidase ErfK/SrfK
LVVDDGHVTEAVADAVGQLKAVTVAIPTKPIAFKTQYNRIITLDYGKYIEVNLSRQHMWVYQDHQVIFDSPITSGATGAGFPTVQGLFSIYAKQTDRNLNGYAIGYNYNVFVKYWMPFYGNYGLHDASWRSSFGGSDYYYGGSHGCVNMPESSAAFLYGWADVGTPVWVHS